MVAIEPLLAFSDNYIWAIHDAGHVAVVDPGDPYPVIRFLEKMGYQLSTILITHHHLDHIGGVSALRAKYPGVAVFAPQHPSIADVTEVMCEDDVVNLPSLGLSLRVLATPGHTMDHIVYYGAGLLFCGDTLFSGGCGRLFEGTPAEMHHSLSKLKALPDETRMYCAHEYTQSNLRFARTVEPDNAALQAYDTEVKRLRDANQPTLPSSMGLEKQINPFLRADNKQVMERLGISGDPVQTFTKLRSMKDVF